MPYFGSTRSLQLHSRTHRLFTHSGSRTYSRCLEIANTTAQNAVLRSHVVRLSVCPSVCLFVCNVGGSGSHRFEILEANCTDNLPDTFALCSPEPSTYFQGNMWKFGENRVGVEKSGMLEHKSGNISEMHRDRGKVTMEGLTNVFWMLPSPTLYGLLFPEIGGL